MTQRPFSSLLVFACLPLLFFPACGKEISGQRVSGSGGANALGGDGGDNNTPGDGDGDGDIPGDGDGDGDNQSTGGSGSLECEGDTLDCDEDPSDCESSTTARETCGACDNDCTVEAQCINQSCHKALAERILALGANAVDFVFDDEGALLVTGSFAQPYDFGSGTRDPGADADFFLAKYSPGGELIWVKTVGATGGSFGSPVRGYAVAIDAARNVYATGSMRGIANFGSGALGADASQEDIFIVGYNEDGGTLWSDHFASSGSSVDQGLGIAVGADRVYFAGVAGLSLDLGNGSIGQLSNSRYLFVSALSRTTGAHIWSKGYRYISEDGYADITDLTIDSQENVYISGSWRGTINLGSGDRVGSQKVVGSITIKTETGFVASYSGSNGNYRWMQTQGGDNSDFTRALAVDSDNNVYATGSFVETPSFGDGPVETTEELGSKGFVVSYQSNGSYRYALTGSNYASHAQSTGLGIAVREGTFYLGMTYAGEAALGGADFREVGGSVLLTGYDVPSVDVALAAFETTSGEFLWLRSYGGVENDSAGFVHMKGENPVMRIRAGSVMTVDGTDIEPISNSDSHLFVFD